MSDFLNELVSNAEKEQYKLLELLFINHRRFPDFKTSSGKEKLCFIEIKGLDPKIYETIIEAKKDVFTHIKEFMSLGNKLAETFDFKKLANQNLQDIIISKQKMKEERSGELIPFFEPSSKNSLLGQLTEPIVENWQKQSPQLRDKKILSEIKKQKGIHQWLRIGICPQCPDFQMIIGKTNSNMSKCSVGHKQSEISIYTFDSDFSEIKISDNDLPHFISEYIKKKTSMMLKPIVNKKVDSGEIDCYIPLTKLGIECKQYVRDFNISQDNTQLFEDLISQLKRYENAGVRRTILVTNVDDSNFSKFRHKVEEKIKEKEIDFEYFKVINKPSAMISEIDKEIAYYAKKQNEKKKK